MEKRKISKFKRPHGLSNPAASGICGEARVTTELLRHGFKVAKPYWTDDEIDLLVLKAGTDSLVPIPIQVKTIQFLQKARRRQPKSVFIKGLRKKYVERQPGLCLAIYCVDKDLIWFIDTAATIRQVYNDQTASSRRVKYSDLSENDNVRIRVRRDEDATLDRWKVPRDDAMWLNEAIKRVVTVLQKPSQRIRSYRHLFGVARGTHDNMGPDVGE